MTGHRIEIISFAQENQEAIRTLNYEWLEKYFRIEEGDLRTLSDPQTHIIDKGGYVFYATVNDEIAGTASLLKKDDLIFELGKMAVTEKMQGYGIGTILLEHCLQFASEKNIKALVLYSNRKLKAALHLYRKYGFTEVQLEPGLYERADIKMYKAL